MNTDLKKSAENFLLMASKGEVNEAYSNYVADGLIHHNPYFEGDARSLMEGMKENANQFPEKELIVKQVIQEGNTVVVHSHVRLKRNEPGAALVHIFRFEQDKMVEIWDVSMPIPEKIINEHGVF